LSSEHDPEKCEAVFMLKQRAAVPWRNLAKKRAISQRFRNHQNLAKAERNQKDFAPHIGLATVKDRLVRLDHQ
jgi:hypothetical protein